MLKLYPKYLKKEKIMTTVKFDLTKVNGTIKRMNAVNNGPAGSIVRKKLNK